MALLPSRARRSFTLTASLSLVLLVACGDSTEETTSGAGAGGSSPTAGSSGQPTGAGAAGTSGKSGSSGASGQAGGAGKGGGGGAGGAAAGGQAGQAGAGGAGGKAGAAGQTGGTSAGGKSGASGQAGVAGSAGAGAGGASGGAGTGGAAGQGEAGAGPSGAGGGGAGEGGAAGKAGGAGEAGAGAGGAGGGGAPSGGQAGAGLSGSSGQAGAGEAGAPSGGQAGAGGLGGAAGGVAGGQAGQGGTNVGGAGSGGQGQCMTASDCPGVEDECQSRTCQAGVCGIDFKAAGTGSIPQIKGDCRKNVCDGLGAVTTQADDSDTPNDGNDCTIEGCSGGVASTSAREVGSACQSNGGKFCDGEGTCVECLGGQDCSSGVCDAFVCQGASCSDGVKNGTETDTDCGGTCGTCALGRACSAGSDCSSGRCQGGTCVQYVSAVGGGGAFTCATHGDGSLKCWGQNSAGQLGYGDTSTRGDQLAGMGDSLPTVDLGTGRTVKAISRAQGNHVCAILDNDTLKCWGQNGSGQLGYGDDYNHGDEPGEMGDSLPTVDLGTGRTVKSVALGGRHSCAILDNGTVKCWGLNADGQLGYGDTLSRGDDPGEMGDNLPAVDLGAGRTAKAVYLGNEHTCAILDDDSLKCWGYGNSGRLFSGSWDSLGDGPGEMGDSLPIAKLGAGRTVKGVALADSHTCALLDNGTVKCAGYNLDGRLGYGDKNPHGTAPDVGDGLPTIDLGVGRTAKLLTGGSNHMCALLDNGAIKCWGQNGSGQLGHGDTDTHGDEASDMGDNLPAIDLGTGRSAVVWRGLNNHSCAILDNDTLKCWGSSSYAQLGQGNLEDLGDNPGEMGDKLPTISF